MRRLLVLRPEPGASATLERARQRGLDAVAAPLFEIAPLAWELPDSSGFDGLLLTSANSVRFGGGQLKSLVELPVYAVGEATADAARGAGFRVVTVGGKGVAELLNSIEPRLRLLHLCGEHRCEPWEPRQPIVTVPVYCATEIASPDLGAAMRAVALIHSPRAARRFASLIGDRGSVCIAAISPSAAAAAGTGWQAVEVAEAATDEALLVLAARLCNKPAE